jgi:hypothetical protein
MRYTTDIIHVPQGDHPQQRTLNKEPSTKNPQQRTLNKVLDELLSDMDRMKFEPQQVQQAIRELRSTTRPLNVYGGIKNG